MKPIKVRNSGGKVRWLVAVPGGKPKLFRSERRAIQHVERDAVRELGKKWKVVNGGE